MYDLSGSVRKPYTSISIVTINPAIGPVMPISKMDFLDDNLERIRITAPSVPNGFTRNGGAGI